MGEGRGKKEGVNKNNNIYSSFILNCLQALIFQPSEFEYS